MSATELQACLARLYTSSLARRLFRVDPEAILAGYFLTSREREMVTSIDWDTLEWFASSLRVKRRDRLERAFPALFAIAAPALETYVERYHELYPLRPGMTSADDATEFAAFLEETLSDGAQLPPYARDLVRFERTLQEVRASLRAMGKAPTHPIETNGSVLPERVQQRPGVRVARFDYNVSAIDDALREGREPEPLEEPEVVVYALREGEHEPRIMRVSEPVALVIELCDGHRSIAEVTAAVEDHYGQPDLGADVEGVIRQLAGSAILEEGNATAA